MIIIHKYTMSNVTGNMQFILSLGHNQNMRTEKLFEELKIFHAQHTSTKLRY